MYKDFIFIVGVMIMALLYMLSFKVLALIVIAIMAYFLNKQPSQPINNDDDEIRYGCPTDYKVYNRNKDFLDE